MPDNEPTLLVTGALVLVAVCLVAFTVRGIRRDPRNPSLAVLLGGSVVAVWLAASALTRGNDPLNALLGAAIIVSPLLVVVLVAFLVINGITMIRKEGRRVGNMLSLLTGLGIAAAVTGSLVLLVGSAMLGPGARRWLLPLALLVMLGCAWIGFLLVCHLAYALLYPRLAARHQSQHQIDYVVVLGCGLIRGRVGKLLANRVDAGIAQWRRLRTANPGVRLIMSGGQGPDEPRSEAAAMAEYAQQQGVPASALRLEDRSRTTEENLRNTSDLVASELGPSTAGLIVTSSFHVLRAAALARQIGLDAQATGAPTAGYFWPSAFLREFVALLVQRPVLTVAFGALVCLPLPLAFALVA